MRKKKIIVNPLSNDGLQTIDEGIKSLEDYIETVGAVRVGLDVEKRASDMQLHHNGGVLYKYNATDDQIDDTVIPLFSNNGFRVMDVDGNVIDAASSAIRTDIYNEFDGSVWTQETVNTDTNATFSEFFVDPDPSSGHQITQLIGQTLYSNINQARQRYLGEAKTVPVELNGHIKFIGFLHRRDANNIDSTRVQIVNISKFGELQVGGSVVASTNLFNSQIIDNINDLQSLQTSTLVSGQAHEVDGVLYVWKPDATSGDFEPFDKVLLTGYWVNVSGDSSIIQTKYYTLSYNTVLDNNSYTHDAPQVTSGVGVDLGVLHIKKEYIGAGLAYVTIDFQPPNFQYDNVFTVTLPNGTINQPISPQRRALRPELNITAKITSVLGVDSISINRDDDIDGNSIAHFSLAGIGDWDGDEIQTNNNNGWNTATLSINEANEGNVVKKFIYKKENKTIYIKGRWDFTSATGLSNGVGAYTVDLSSICTIDTTLTGVGNPHGSGDSLIIGSTLWHDNGIDDGIGCVFAASQSNISFLISKNELLEVWSSSAGGVVSQPILVFDAEIPIL